VKLSKSIVRQLLISVLLLAVAATPALSGVAGGGRADLPSGLSAPDRNRAANAAEPFHSQLRLDAVEPT